MPKEITDPFEYISQFIPLYIIVDGTEYRFMIICNHPHYDYRICYEAHNDTTDFLYLYENAGDSVEMMMNLRLLRHDLERDNLLDDLYKGEGYTKEMFDKHLRGEL